MFIHKIPRGSRPLKVIASNLHFDARRAELLAFENKGIRYLSGMPQWVTYCLNSSTRSRLSERLTKDAEAIAPLNITRSRFIDVFDRLESMNDRRILDALSRHVNVNSSALTGVELPIMLQGGLLGPASISEDDYQNLWVRYSRRARSRRLADSPVLIKISDGTAVYDVTLE